MGDGLDRYQVVFSEIDNEFYVIEVWDFDPAFDVPLSEESTDYNMLKKMKASIEKLQHDTNVDVVEYLRRDVFYNELLADAINA